MIEHDVMKVMFAQQAIPELDCLLSILCIALLDKIVHRLSAHKTASVGPEAPFSVLCLIVVNHD